MKRKFALPLILILIASFSFTGCIIQDDNYNQQPGNGSTGYYYLFNEDFNADNRGWSFDDPIDSAYALVTNGAYKFVDYSYAGGYNLAVVPTGAVTHRNFLVQTRLKSNYAMALIFGASNNDFGYSLYLDEQGYFAVYKEGYPSQTIIDWQYNSAITAGWNDVELEQIDGYWYGYVNNVKIFQTPARSLSGNQFGFMVLPGTTGYADFLTVKW
ncbi:MAG: hypothetical protein EOO04_29625 [Chitinophagaceae bacterium]|nr:MAG: hypothetical protein EOO04_29625 [Chitinophagaceae bacterium]